MPEEQSDNPKLDESPGSTSPPEKANGDVARWIKNLGALVTIFTAIAGLWFTAYQLRIKADADNETAKFNRDAEADKLALGKLQLNDQAKARAEQAELHKQDLNLELEKHREDIRQAQGMNADADAKNAAERLSALISHIFSGSQLSVEGDLATLFEYLGQNVKTDVIVENAVLARLENPRSREEVDLGFRILERIGYSSIDITAQANRSARVKYDDCLRKELSDKSQGVGPNEFGLLEVEIASSTPLDRSYVYATLNHYIYGPVVHTLADFPSSLCPQPFAPYVISRSNEALSLQRKRGSLELRQVTPRKKGTVDLRHTYLTSDILDIGDILEEAYAVNLDGAYLGLDRSFSSLYFDDATKRMMRKPLHEFADVDISIAILPGPEIVDYRFRRLALIPMW